jgi:prephenate dehydratase
VLAPAIETVPENFTRFLAVRRRSDATPIPHADKDSVCFSAGHQPGSLAQILTLLATEGANLTKIQSAPLLGRPWEYRFFADFTAFPDRIPEVLRLLDQKTTDLQVLGVYREGVMNDE